MWDCGQIFTGETGNAGMRLRGGASQRRFCCVCRELRWPVGDQQLHEEAGLRL